MPLNAIPLRQSFDGLGQVILDNSFPVSTVGTLRKIGVDGHQNLRVLNCVNCIYLNPKVAAIPQGPGLCFVNLVRIEYLYAQNRFGTLDHSNINSVPGFYQVLDFAA